MYLSLARPGQTNRHSCFLRSTHLKVRPKIMDQFSAYTIKNKLTEGQGDITILTIPASKV